LTALNLGDSIVIYKVLFGNPKMDNTDMFVITSVSYQGSLVETVPKTFSYKCA